METQPSSLPGQPKALTFIAVTVILNTLGFTLIVPVAPFLVSQYISDPNTLGLAVGWLGSIYAICQMVAAPGLGALSDRYGRRPILLLCLLGSALGYGLLGIGGTLWVLFLGRAIDGITGANTSIIIAYITDVIPAEQRSRYFGLIGALGAACVILGPAVGGLIARLSYQAPFYAAGGVALANVIYGLFFMPESLPKSRRTGSIRIASLNPLRALSDVFALPKLRWLIVTMFLFTLSTLILPSNLGLFTKAGLNWDVDRVGLLFSIFGISSIIVQGVILQWLLKRLPAWVVMIAGLCFTIVSLLLIALVGWVPSPALLTIGIIVFAVGEGFTSPTLLELITQATAENAHGKVQGGSQSVQSLANIGGPLLAGALFDHLGHSSPYFAAAGISVLACGAVALILPTIRQAPLPIDEDPGA
jgi:MFS transporter, DHA1 family, tetracycline resistance protein